MPAPLSSGGSWSSRQAKIALLVLAAASRANDGGSGDAVFGTGISGSEQKPQFSLADVRRKGNDRNDGKPCFAAFLAGFALWGEEHEKEKVTSG